MDDKAIKNRYACFIFLKMKKFNILVVGMILLSIFSMGLVNAANEGTNDYKRLDVRLISKKTVYEDSVLRLTVKVRDKNTQANIQGASVSIAMPGYGPIRTDRKGRAIFNIPMPKVPQNLQQTTYTTYATVSATGYYPVIRAPTTVTIKSVLRLQLNIPKARVGGRSFIARAVVTDIRTGSRVSGARVEFSDPWSGKTKSVTTNNNGVATTIMLTQQVTENTKKTVTAKVTYNGYTATKSKEIRIKAAPLKELDIDVKSTYLNPNHRKIHITVTSEGEPVPEVKIVTDRWTRYTAMDGKINIIHLWNDAGQESQYLSLVASKPSYKTKSGKYYIGPKK